MLRDIWTNKWFIGGFGFLIVFAVLCYFWYQHDIASFQQQLSATGNIVFQGDISQKAQKTFQTDVPLIESQEERQKSLAFWQAGRILLWSGTFKIPVKLLMVSVHL